MSKLQVAQAKQAAEFAKVPGLSPETLRKLTMIRTQITSPAPSTPGAAEEFSALQARIQGLYGKGHGTLRGQPINGSDIEEAMATDRNPDELKEMWLSWHDSVGTPMKADYVRMVDIANAGARELGYADTGALWRANYDMSPDQFAALTEKVWAQVRPLYQQLHCYVRGKLNAKYGDAVQPRKGPIRADLLGNMWAQEWGGIYDLVAPQGAGDIGYDLTSLLKDKGYDPLKMVKTGEGFYTSLGFQPLPATFWQRSQFTKPRDREVVCHASAWDLDNVDDLRVKMCIKVDASDFVTIHHELGHNFYQRAYNQQPSRWYMEGANDGFHEAIGDTMALSITPDYLVKLGLLDPARVPGPDKDIGLLLRQAMDKVAFLPFGLLIDRWRWGVFSGEIAPANYEKAWNDMRLSYQGGAAGAARGRCVSIRGQVSRAGGRALYPLFPGADPAIPVLRSGLQGSRLERPAASVQLLWQSQGGRQARRHAQDGRVQALARRAGSLHRHARDERRGHAALFRAAFGLAQEAERRPGLRLVNPAAQPGMTCLDGGRILRDPASVVVRRSVTSRFHWVNLHACQSWASVRRFPQQTRTCFLRMLGMEIRLPAIACAVIGGIMLATTPSARAETVSAMTPASVVTALKAQGYQATLGEDSSGDPLVTADIGGWRSQVVFYDCNEVTHAACQSLQFSSSFHPERPFDAEKAVAFVNANRFGAVSVAADKSVTVSWDVITGSGIDTSVFAMVVKSYRMALDRSAAKCSPPAATRNWPAPRAERAPPDRAMGRAGREPFHPCGLILSKPSGCQSSRRLARLPGRNRRRLGCAPALAAFIESLGHQAAADENGAGHGAGGHAGNRRADQAAGKRGCR
jgi:hypothetical protein